MLYFSSSCIETDKTTDAVMALIASGVRNIELSNGNAIISDVLEWLLSLKQNYKLNLLIHNYFPPPAEKFVLNLASQDKDILGMSRQHCKTAITLASKIGCPVYSVHAGFRNDPMPTELGGEIDSRKAVAYELAYATMVDSLIQLCDFADEFNIKIAVENHELDQKNLIMGKNELLLMCEANEFLKLFEDVRRDNLKILLDFGHLNVSAATLNFNKFEFIDKIKDKLALFHASHNNGQKDEHGIITSKSWFWPIRKKYADIDCVVESHRLSDNSIRQIVRMFK